MPELDRRRGARQRGWFAARVQSKSGGAMAVAQDVSDGGALLVSRRALPVDGSVDVSLYLNPSVEPPWMLRGRVVRIRSNEADPHGLWPHKVAIKFDEPIPHLVESIAV